jgi:hypothetical protein
MHVAGGSHGKQRGPAWQVPLHAGGAGAHARGGMQVGRRGGEAERSRGHARGGMVVAQGRWRRGRGAGAGAHARGMQVGRMQRGAGAHARGGMHGGGKMVAQGQGRMDVAACRWVVVVGACVRALWWCC